MKLSRLLFALLLVAGSVFRVSAQWSALPLLVDGTDTASSVAMIKSFGGKTFVCTNKGLFVTYDNGDSWINLSFRKPVTAGKNILSFYYDYVADKLYAGGDSAVYASTDNGASWYLTAIRSIDRANDISKAGFNIVVSRGVPGYPSGGIYYSDDDLATYKVAVMPLLPAFGLLTDGAMAFAGGKDGAYVSTDMGVTWDVSGSGHPGGARYGKLERHKGSIYAGDINGHGLWRSRDEGNVWGEVSSTAFKNFCQVFDISANGDIILTLSAGVCTADDQLKASVDDGANWYRMMTGLPPGYFTRLGKNSDATCFYVFNQNDRTLYRNCAPLSAVEISAEPVSLHPNPVTDRLYIGGLRSAVVRISNMLGQQLLQQEFKEEDIQIDLGQLAPGVYFVTLQHGAANSSYTIVKR